MRLQETEDVGFLATNGDTISPPSSSDEAPSVVAVREIIKSIPGEDPDREGLQDTPSRYARALAELTSGYLVNVDEEIAVFDVMHQEGMVLQANVPVYSLCEHHLLPFFGDVHIAYLPDRSKGILGLSKFTRIVDVFAKRLQVQERLTSQIADTLERVLEPRGVAVIMTCRHMCMEMRGVKSRGASTTTTIQKRGLFRESDALFREFCDLLRAGDEKQNGELQLHPDDPPTPTCCFDAILSVESESITFASGGDVPRTTEALEPTFANVDSSNTCPDLQDSDDYRLYLSCAKAESSSIAKAVADAAMGPLSLKKPNGLSILDIGAGNGSVLRELCSIECSIKIARYTAFERDENLCCELRTTAARLGFNGKNSRIVSSEFGLQTSEQDLGGLVDIVLLSHCLYGSSQKEKQKLVDHAMQFVSPRGILMIVHRWESQGTLDAMSEVWTLKGLLHHLSIWESKLCLSGLDESQCRRLSRYTNGDLRVLHKTKDIVRRWIGCLAIEPGSCNFGNKELVYTSLKEAREQVGYMARKKTPSFVVKPNTIVGIQACLRAAAKQTLGSTRHVTVIGGGHSENAFADNAIAINMSLWSYVEVDPIRRLVKFGGGTKSGEITKQCEKHGLLVSLGDRPGVGAGLVLQGGLNHFMRQFGLATDNIVKVVYINPDGALCTAATDEELFPFRGAGSNFGVVLEITVRAFPTGFISAQSILYPLPESTYEGVLSSYSATALSLPDTSCLDGYLFWKSHSQLCFATSHFGSSNDLGAKADRAPLLAPLKGIAEVGAQTFNSPSQLYDRELYMTDVFLPHNVLKAGEIAPTKLRSNKRCLFLPRLSKTHEKILSTVMQKAPNKWCYIHFLHGGEATSCVKPTEVAFGCRDWMFAAVITARWPSGDEEMENKGSAWLAIAVDLLLSHSSGVYGSDLGPNDYSLARLAFGPNLSRLARMKQEVDPLNVIGCACPISAAAGDRAHSRGVVVIFCGRRYAGKDWLASNVDATLRGQGLGELCQVVSISEETKRAFARENGAINEDDLIRNRSCKERHRKSLADFYSRKKTHDVAYDAKCYIRAARRSDGGSILLLTGLRDGLDYARRLARNPVVLVHVASSDQARRGRGWAYDAEIDESEGETAADSKDSAFWDVVYNNDAQSTPLSAVLWTKNVLVPCILQRCTRSIPDVPQPGVQYRDILGSLLLQPFAMPLWTASVVNWVENNGQESSVDAVVSPEAVGYAFAGPIATCLKKPLILLRKEGKLFGDRVTIRHGGSNIHNLSRSAACEPDACDATGCAFEIPAGSILPGQRILVVDDCLASGSTLQATIELIRRQGGVVTKLAVLMELPDLAGRTSQNLDVFSMIRFPGK